MRHTILVVDDDREVAECHASIATGLGCRAFVCTDPMAVSRMLRENPAIELVLLDLRLPFTSGFELLQWLRSTYPEIGVVIATVVNDIERAVATIKTGAYNYLLKPLQPDRLGETLRSYFESRPQSLIRDPRFASFLTASQAFESIFRRVKSFAEADIPVLIEGETGTGKELVAQLIHSISARRLSKFVAVNAAALSSQLFESELFGHRKGAFTGALRDHPGYFRSVVGGTLFLDEIGEIGQEQQKKLLRVLQTGRFISVGETFERKLEARLIFATNRDLRGDAESKQYRADLYYRLANYRISLPPLRTRTGDIELLAKYFLQKYNSQFHRQIQGFNRESMELLLRYSFPGNVRELEGIVSGAILVESGSWIQPSSLPDNLRYAPASPVEGIAAARRRVAVQALADCQGNRTLAAKKLGIARGTLGRILRG